MNLYSIIYNIYPILHYPPLILSRSLRSLANKQTSPIFDCVTPVSVSLATLARQLGYSLHAFRIFYTHPQLLGYSLHAFRIFYTHPQLLGYSLHAFRIFYTHPQLLGYSLHAFRIFYTHPQLLGYSLHAFRIFYTHPQLLGYSVHVFYTHSQLRYYQDIHCTLWGHSQNSCRDGRGRSWVSVNVLGNCGQLLHSQLPHWFHVSELNIQN